MEIDNFIAISLISEFSYCPRRFYLKYIENTTCDNEYTIEGTIEHNKVHNNTIEKRENFVKVTNLNVFSKKYELIGKCDVVEFTKSKNGVEIPFLTDKYEICPVEYKHGKIRNEIEYNMQLCAQVLCIEEMYNTYIEKADIYYTTSNKRITIDINENLRENTILVISKIKNLILNPIIIKPKYLKRCNKCSMVDICSPKKIIISDYMNNLWEEIN